MKPVMLIDLAFMTVLLAVLIVCVGWVIMLDNDKTADKIIQHQCSQEVTK